MRSIEAKARWAGQLVTPSKWAVLGGLGLASALVACGDSAEDSGSGTHDTEAGEPTTSSADTQGSGGETSSADTPRDPTSEETAESEEPEPIPASSEGPAENWPEPEVPDALYEPTEEGAEALIQYWFEARHYARITGDVEILEEVSLPDCELCEAEIDTIDEIYPAGWFLEEEHDEVQDSFVRLEEEDVASGLFELHMNDFQTFVEGEFYSETVDNSNAVFGMDFRFREGRWQAYDFTPLGEADTIEDAER